MGKQPAFQMYPGDWKRSVEVKMASLSTRGAWIEMLLSMWDAPERGKLKGTFEDFSALVGCNIEEIQNAIFEIKKRKIANVTQKNGIVTVINRRMYREYLHDLKVRKQTRKRVRNFRETQKKRKCNAPVHPSSSSSSSSTYKKKEKYKKERKDFYPDWLDLDLWSDFIKYRKTINAPLTERAEKILLTELGKLINAKQGTQKSIIEQTIASGKWSGLFPVKTRYDPGYVPPHKPPEMPSEEEKPSLEEIRKARQELQKKKGIKP